MRESWRSRFFSERLAVAARARKSFALMPRRGAHYLQFFTSLIHGEQLQKPRTTTAGSLERFKEYHCSWEYIENPGRDTGPMYEIKGYTR